MQLNHNVDYSSPAVTGDASTLFGKGGITLSDALDIINPLEHIPFISTLYDAMTGSTPKAGSQLAGGALYGGPLGIITSAINLAFEGETGHDIVGSVVAGLSGDETAPATKLADASADAAAPAPISNSANNASVTANANAAPVDPITQTPVAEILPPAKSATKPEAGMIAPSHSQDVLSLFDAPTTVAPAHNAYRKAQTLNAPVVTPSGLVM